MPKCIKNESQTMGKVERKRNVRKEHNQERKKIFNEAGWHKIQTRQI